jgi:hypothetical protein
MLVVLQQRSAPSVSDPVCIGQPQCLVWGRAPLCAELVGRGLHWALFLQAIVGGV